MKKTWQLSFIFFMLFIVIACNNETATSSDPPAATPSQTQQNQTAKEEMETPPEPFTLVIYAGGVSEEEFDHRFRGKLEEQFPHITFEYQTGAPGIADRVVAGEIPDLIRTDIPTLRTGYLDLGLGEDLMPYVKKYNYDLSRFNQSFLTEIHEYMRDGKLYGLPVPPYFPNVLYYNIDLFDAFGVEYPKDGMTWDETYELAQTLTRMHGDTQIRGFTANILGMTRDNAFSVPILDPEADKLGDETLWQKVFTNLYRFYQIPGNEMTSNAVEFNAFSEGVAAMSAHLHSVYLVIPENINWDIVSIPVMEGAPARVNQRGPAYWSIASTSKHKDAAFEAIMVMLSDEIQMEDSLKGIPTTLDNEEIQAVLGQGDPIYKTKNMKAISYYPPTEPKKSRAPGLVDVPMVTQQAIIRDAFIEYASNQKDLNTALRDASEKLKQYIEEEKAKQ